VTLTTHLPVVSRLIICKALPSYLMHHDTVLKGNLMMFTVTDIRKGGFRESLNVYVPLKTSIRVGRTA
jgi:hypothetical protein